MRLVRAGLPWAEVRGWSWPRLVTWTEAVHGAEIDAALLQAAAVWDPKAVRESRPPGPGDAGPAEWEPVSEKLRRLETLLKDAKNA